MQIASTKPKFRVWDPVIYNTTDYITYSTIEALRYDRKSEWYEYLCAGTWKMENILSHTTYDQENRYFSKYL